MVSWDETVGESNSSKGRARMVGVVEKGNSMGKSVKQQREMES